MSESVQISTNDLGIILGTLHSAIDRLSDGRHENPHCVAYGMVAVRQNDSGDPGESYYVLFNTKNSGLFKIERFENKDNFQTGHMVYFYDDKAEAIVQSTLRGEGDTFQEIE